MGVRGDGRVGLCGAGVGNRWVVGLYGAWLTCWPVRVRGGWMGLAVGLEGLWSCRFSRVQSGRCRWLGRGIIVWLVFRVVVWVDGSVDLWVGWL